MKKLLLTLLMTLSGMNLLATHHMTYFVYVESHFPQGYWKDSDLIDARQGAFLYPYQYTDLLGTVQRDFFQTLLDRLEQHHDFYSRVELASPKKADAPNGESDTLAFVIGRGLTPDQLSTLRNELTATLLNTGLVRVVELNYRDGSKKHSLDEDDLEIPLFELMPAGKQALERKTPQGVRDTVYQTRTDTVAIRPESSEKGLFSRHSCWDRYLWLAIIVVLLILLLRQSALKRT